MRIKKGGAYRTVTPADYYKKFKPLGYVVLEGEKAKPKEPLVTVSKKTRGEYDALTRNELIKLLTVQGVVFNRRWNKDRLIDALIGGD